MFYPKPKPILLVRGSTPNFVLWEKLNMSTRDLRQKKPFDEIYARIGVENQARTDSIRKDCCAYQAKQTLPFPRQ